MTKLTFKYTTEKDAENFIRGMQSVNNKTPTKLQEEYATLHGSNLSIETVESFLKNKRQNEKTDFEAKTVEISIIWQPIESEFLSRSEALFQLELPEKVIGYLASDYLCTYNWRENYFFIFVDAPSPVRTIMHELLHFYTHRKYQTESVDPKKFNDIKEALTVILNTEFADLLNGVKDTGWEQHQEIRSKIVELRKEGKSLDEIVNILAEN